MPTDLAELRAPNAEAARAFYAAVLDCTLEERTLDESRPGFACVRDDQDVALITQADQVVVSAGGDAAWVGAEPRFAVADLAEAISRARILGAEVVEDDEGHGVVCDPQGARFTLVV